MKMLKVISCLLFIGLYSAINAQSFEIVYPGDTINRVDKNNIKQGFWKISRGMIYESGYFLNGYKEGVWISYGVNGKPSLLEAYHQGKLNGPCFVFDENGSLRNERHMKDDKMDGRNASYDKDGNPIMLRNYKKGDLHGEYLEYYENGQIREQSFYKNGLKDSISTYKSENGEPIAIIHYKDGNMQGTYNTYFESGILRSAKYYEENKAEGKFYEYFDNSRIKVEGNFKNDKKDGDWIYYDINNRKIKVEKYKEGLLIKTKITRINN